MKLPPLLKASIVFLLLSLSLTLACGRLTGRQTPPPPRDKEEAAVSAKKKTDAPQKKDDDSATPAPLIDRGIFSDLDPQVTLGCPPWLEEGPHLAIRSKETGRTWLAVDGVIVCEASSESSLERSALLVEKTPQDRDNDGIPDAVDVLRGAKKAAQNGAAYKNNYRPLAFPGGDVPREEGVCTDVVIRSLRNTGIDLQESVSRDIEARPEAYPMIKDADPHIDHRRVRTLLPYFEHAFESLPATPGDTAAPYLPGDIVLMNTIGDQAPEHLGIVSDEVGDSGLPLIINNWTQGTVTRAMDLLHTIPVTHRFRAVLSLQLSADQRGLKGLLSRQNLTLPKETKQILLVTVPLWKSTGGTLRQFERTADGFVAVGEPVAVRVGSGGLARGRGVPGADVHAPHQKREGDKKAPAGVFRLGTAFGTRAHAPYRGNGWPYRATTPRDFWIDDPKSPQYNEWITLDEGDTLAWSAERLQMYTLALVVLHNTNETVKGAGSAIFLHPFRDAETPTVGCTALPPEALKAVLGWLDPDSRPVLIQVAEHVF